MPSSPTDGRRIGVLGGTFDPIHLGHLVTAEQVAETLGLDQVLVVPAGRPWQKSPQIVTDARHRVAMVDLAVADNDLLTISQVDVDRPGATYAVDTLRDLARQFPEAELMFIVGADALQGFGTWREPDAVLRAAHLVAVTRPGFPLATANLPSESFTTVTVTGVDVSATECRRRARLGQSLRYIVPDPVRCYITTHRLYQP